MAIDLTQDESLEDLQKRFGALAGAFAHANAQSLKKNPELFVGVIIYPINGRAGVTDPFQHWSFDREQTVQFLVKEIKEQEPWCDVEVVSALLMQKDRIRVGRVVGQIIHFDRNIDNDETIEVME